MPLIDTLALKTGLLDGGMPEPQAAAIVTALADADTGQLATKADLEGLRADVRTEISDVRTEISDVRTEVETLRADMTLKIEALRGEMTLKIEALRAEMSAKIETLRGDFKALNGKVNLLLAFNTPLLFAVLALLWRTFFATPQSP